MPARQFRGRRVLQSFIALIGLAIVALAILDLNRTDRSGTGMGEDGPQPIQDINRFLDDEVGYLPIDIAMLALGGWIVFFGLHGVLLRGPQLSFDADGIRYFRFGDQLIPWSAIHEIRFVHRRRTSLVRAQALDLELKDPAPFAARQPLGYRLFRRTVHLFDPKIFTIHGYDVEAPMFLVARAMQEIVEPEPASESTN